MKPLNTTTIHTQIDNMQTICKDGKREVKQLIDTLLVQLGHQVEKPQEGLWKPEYNETYFTIQGWGKVETQTRCTESEYKEPYDFGNLFKDKATAEKAAKYRSARNRLELLAAQYNGEFNWRPINYTSAYFICRSRGTNEYLIYSWEYDDGSQVFFKTVASAEKALSQLTDDDKKVLFGGNT